MYGLLTPFVMLVVGMPLCAAGFWGAEPEAHKAAALGRDHVVDLGDEVHLQMKWMPALNGWVGQYEVTNEQYRRFRSKHHSGRFRGHTLEEDQQPVVRVSLQDGMDGAIPFADWLTALDRSANRIPTGYAYRLPTSAEWLQLAKGGQDWEFPWGASWPPTTGNYADQSAQSLFGDTRVIGDYRDGYPVACPVERSGSHVSGLYGLGGNVWEWTVVPGAEELGEARGGSWLDRSPAFLQLTGCYRIPRTYGFEGLGFRVMLMPVSP